MDADVRPFARGKGRTIGGDVDVEPVRFPTHLRLRGACGSPDTVRRALAAASPLLSALHMTAPVSSARVLTKKAVLPSSSAIGFMADEIRGAGNGKRDRIFRGRHRLTMPVHRNHDDPGHVASFNQDRIVGDDFKGHGRPRRRADMGRGDRVLDIADSLDFTRFKANALPDSQRMRKMTDTGPEFFSQATCH